MSIISQETLDKFTQEEKEKLIKYYKEAEKEKQEVSVIMLMKYFFGKENLQPKPKILHNT